MIMSPITKIEGVKMEIPINIAQNIVNTLEKNIGYKINFMNSDAVIIASSDDTRIGENHEGAAIVLRTKKPFTTTLDMDFTYSREGIDLPVEIDGQIIGTVGITGKAEEVEIFGTIIKTMTEILITSYLARNAKQYDLERERSIVSHLLYQTTMDFRSDEKLRIKDIKNQSNHVIVWMNTEELDNILERTELYSYFKGMLSDYKHFISILNYEIILIVDSNISEARLRQINNYHSLQKFILGIGHPVETISNLGNSYDVAKFIATETNEPVYSYQYLEDKYLLKTANNTASDLYINKVIKNISREDMESFSLLLEVYEKHNGSIKKISEELFIHKNTVQYRLDKILEGTGYNPRELSDFYKLKLAFNLWKYKEGAEKGD